MKKILFFAVLAVALAGFGLHMGVAQAQTANTATLQQQLDVAKASLVNLEMQKGIIPQGDDQLGNSAATSAQSPATVTQTTSGLSASQISAFEDTLTTLAATLSQLNTSLSANPNMTANQETAVATTLSGMKSTLIAMAATISASEVTSPIAMSAPATSAPATPKASAPVAAESVPTQVAQTAPAPTPAATVVATSPATTSPVVATKSAPVQATAQASSIWSFTKSHWPAIVIILLVIVILAILFWPENTGEETATPVVTSNTKASTPSVSAAVASAPAKASTQPTMTAPADSTKIA